MNWSNPGIGFGKAGNNPYQWLALGGAGLQSMLNTSPTNDPGNLENEQFLRAAAASGQPQSSIPRETHGLLPMLMEKLGVLSPEVKASADEMNMQKIYLAIQEQQKQQQRVANLKDMLGVITNAAKISPEIASMYYKAMPNLQIPGVTAEEIAKIKTVPQEVSDAKLAERDKEQGLREKLIDAQIAHLQDLTNKPDKGQELQNHRLYAGMVGALKSRANSPLGMANADNLNKGVDFLLNAEASGEDPQTAWQQAQALVNPPQQADSSTNYLDALGHMLKGLLPGSSVAGTTPGAAPVATSTPTVVRPSFMK